jgi:anti-sigma factor RsiW
MTCREYEPLLALYVGGDLDGCDVEGHLADCAECRALLEDLRASQALLKELSAEAVDAALLSAVRAGVLAKTRPRRLWPWVAACAAAAALVMALIPARAPIPKRAPALPKTEAVRAVPTPTSKPALARRKRPRRQPHKAEPLVVKVLTDDPNIVIIWLVDQPGD